MSRGSRDELKAPRKARLAQEVAEEGFSLLDPGMREDSQDGMFGLPGPQELDEVEDALLDELLYCRYPPVHEQRVPSYGCIVFAGEIASDLPQGLTEVTLGSFGNLDEVRPLADGIHTFLVRGATAGEALVSVDSADELDLVELARDAKCWIMQRHPSGAVRVFRGQSMLRNQDGLWTYKPYSDSRTFQFLHVTGLDGSEAQMGLGILDLCLHVLSARRIGATIVWVVRQDPATFGSAFSRAPHPIPAVLNVTDPHHVQPLVSLLASVDGACLVGPDGAIEGVEGFIGNSAAAEAFIDAHSGTRHTTAARLSYDQPEVLVFVVSSDGPVTVFSDGVDLLRLDEATDYMHEMDFPFHDGPGQNPRTTKRASCGRCSASLLIETEDTGEPAGTDGAYCPVCRHPLEPLGGKRRIRPVKPWEDEDATVSWGLPTAVRTHDFLNTRYNS